MLFGEEERLMTISVVGMGGLGKTTLVKKVYEQAKEVKLRRFDVYAWISVSQPFREAEILRKLTAETSNEPTRPGVDATYLIQMLRDYFEDKKFLLVLDDVWDAHAWRVLKSALPDRGRGSRVIIITRKSDVAAACRERPSDVTYQLQPLDPEMALSLFYDKAFGSIEEKDRPQDIQDFAQNLVNKCGGLPLAIVSLGRLLSSKSLIEWREIYGRLGPSLENDDRLKTILMFSYYDLPRRLQSCFLFLRIFPEDYTIKRMTLIRLWIAEGLIEREPGRSLEQVADDYLTQLIGRNLVEVAERKHGAQVKTCRVHDVVREVILPLYEEVGLFSSARELKTTPCNRRIRRLSIYNNGEPIPSYKKLTRLRSFYLFGVHNPSAWISSIGRLRWLRVVSLENLPLERFPAGLTKLPLLRYLSLENTKMKKLPDSVGKLKQLETLNLKGTSVRELPPSILKLRRLRHLLVYKYGEDGIYPFRGIDGVKVPPGMSSLTSLQKLGYIEAEGSVVTELGHLTELRKLCVVKLASDEGNDFCASVEKMTLLKSLHVKSAGEDEVIKLQSLSHPPHTLERLYLSGRLDTLAPGIPFLPCLVALSLWGSRLKDDPLRALQSLPSLVELELVDAYDGDELCCDHPRGYPKLKHLRLQGLIGLKEVKVEEGALCNVVRLIVSRCQQLLLAPFSLLHLTNIQ